MDTQNKTSLTILHELEMTPGSSHHRPPFVHWSTTDHNHAGPSKSSLSIPPVSQGCVEKQSTIESSSNHTVPHEPQSNRLYHQRRAPADLERQVRGRWRTGWGEWGEREREGGGIGDRWRNWRCADREGGLGRALMLGWVGTTLGFLLAAGIWKGELFHALDNLSKQLYAMEYEGKFIFGFLIFITTIPPLPLYSTLIVLSGYTFGVWEGFLISYMASLIGAVIVFVVSRTFLRDVIGRSLQSSPTATSLLQIIPDNPHLLLLIRIAPYPYNLLNVILASSPSLTLFNYTACTALSLCKLVLHTWIGAGIHDLSSWHKRPPHHDLHSPHGPRPWHHHRPPWSTGHGSQDDTMGRDDVKFYSTIVGVTMCLVLFVYLTHLAKRALARVQIEQELRQGDEEGISLEDEGP
ncbi:hypothetical protein M231_04891 [Tremella mesenterica]|uniref:Golgi apparatus membrane protein TVP38 n=1 Tax=Tremella mesenterica TaxID=5217 RepID=A0A4Q1BJX8_TREME|nr:hypothetical protein M231_04891 [Tremella mesenterica]